MLKRKEKEERKLDRKQNSDKGKSLEEMMAYVDENGNITTTPPNPGHRREFDVAEIQISVQKRVDEEPDAPRTGTVTFFNEAKGFGFIKDDLTKESIFVHINSLAAPLKENNRVSYIITMGSKGPVAENVSLVR